MRIISSFHDYYDIGLKYGIDPKCIFQREQIEIPNTSPVFDKVLAFLRKSILAAQ